MSFPGHEPRGKKVIKKVCKTKKNKQKIKLKQPNNKVIFWGLNPHLHNCENPNFIQIPPLSLKKAKAFLGTLHTSCFLHQAMGSYLLCGCHDAHDSKGTGMSDMLLCTVAPRQCGSLSLHHYLNEACLSHAQSLCNVILKLPACIKSRDSTQRLVSRLLCNLLWLSECNGSHTAWPLRVGLLRSWNLAFAFLKHRCLRNKHGLASLRMSDHMEREAQLG